MAEHRKFAVRQEKRWFFAAPALLAAALLSGCAKVPPRSDQAAYQNYQEQNDPLEPTNRFLFRVNDKISQYFLRPIAKGYLHVTTVGMRTHVSDFVTNMGEPGEMIYFAAAGKSRDAGTALARFGINTVIGFGGIFDPASNLGYRETSTDLGLTLAEWGVPPGPYLYLPLFGPSGARDVWALPAQFILTPTIAPPPSRGLTIFSDTTTALHLVNSYASYLNDIDQVEATALDPYATFRSLYRQSRAAQLQLINRRNVPTVPDWFPQPQPAAPAQ